MSVFHPQRPNMAAVVLAVLSASAHPAAALAQVAPPAVDGAAPGRNDTVGDPVPPADPLPTAPANTSPTPAGEPDMLDPNSPMADIPGMEVQWPDFKRPIDLATPASSTPGLTEPTTSPAPVMAGGPAVQRPSGIPTAPNLADRTAGEPTADSNLADVAKATVADVVMPGQDMVRYDVVLTGLDHIDAARIRRRFAELSTLNKDRGKGANVAQINRRARSDVDLLDHLLRIEGYYDNVVMPTVTAGGSGQLEVTLQSDPGALYHFGTVNLPGIASGGPDTARFLRTFGIQPGDPVKQDRIVDQTALLASDIAENGYPFATVGDPDLTIDHESLHGDLTVPVTLNGKYDFGAINITRGAIFGRRGAAHLQRIARFRPGQVYRQSDVEDLRQAIIATGLIAGARLTPVKAATPGLVDLDVALRPGPHHTVSGELGYDTGQGFRAAASWQDHNLFPPEGALILSGVAGTQEQLASVTFRRNNWLGRDRVLSATLLASHIITDAYDARTVSLIGGFERKSTIIFQKEWTWSVSPQLIYTSERALFQNLGDQPGTQQFRIAALSGSLNYDGTDDLLDPRHGVRLGGSLSPELSFGNGTNPYLRAQIDASTYHPLNGSTVLAARVRLGTIVGATIDEIAPSRRNYAGGGGSVRGYGYQRIGPLYTNGNPIGGRGLAEFSLEGRFRTGLFNGNLGFVPFIDAGTVSTTVLPEFKTVRVGAGVGIRYYTSFGPIRVDVATPINPAPGDSRIGVYVSLGQAF